MKKAKKLLSVFLAALMVMTTLGSVMMASAATEAEAQAAAEEFNATRPDHSAVFEDMSVSSAKQTKDTLNGLLSAILGAVNIKGTLYSDQTLSSLMILLNGGLDILSDLKPGDDKFAATVERAGYTDAAAYIKSLSSWDDANAADIKWGITPGNADEFIKASGAALMGIGQILQLALLVGVYDNVAAVMEAFHTVKMPTGDVFIAEDYGFVDEENKPSQESNLTVALLKRLAPSIDALLANPLNVLTDALPDLVGGYESLSATINANQLAVMFGLSLPDFGGLLTLLGSGIGLTFPAVDTHYLITMGEAYAAESGVTGGSRMAIKGDQPMVFAALMGYVGEMLETPENQAALAKLIGDQIGAGFGDDLKAVVEAAQSGDVLRIADASITLCESIAEKLGVDSGNEGIGGFFAKVMDFFNRIARMIVDLFKGFGGKVAA